MKAPRIVDLSAPTPMPDLSKLSKSRRDWLEVFGNQWGPRAHRAEEKTLSAEESAALRAATNPFSTNLSTSGDVLIHGSGD